MWITKTILAVWFLTITPAPLIEPTILAAPVPDAPLMRSESIVRMVLQESNGEPERGMIAVAAVALDRVSHGNWPNSEKAVVYQRRQFAGMSQSIKAYSPIEVRRARDAVSRARAGARPCGNAYWFHATWMPLRPSWVPLLRRLCVIGDHEFYGFR